MNGCMLHISNKFVLLFYLLSIDSVIRIGLFYHTVLLILIYAII